MVSKGQTASSGPSSQALQSCPKLKGTLNPVQNDSGPNPARSPKSRRKRPCDRHGHSIFLASPTSHPPRGVTGSQRFWMGARRLGAGSGHCSVPKPQAKSLNSLVLGVTHQSSKKLEENMCGASLLAPCSRIRVPLSFLHVDHARVWRLEETLGVSKSAIGSQQGSYETPGGPSPPCSLYGEEDAPCSPHSLSVRPSQQNG